MGYVNKPKKQTYNIINDCLFVSDIEIFEHVNGQIKIKASYSSDHKQAFKLDKTESIIVSAKLNEQHNNMDHHIINGIYAKQWQEENEPQVQHLLHRF